MFGFLNPIVSRQVLITLGVTIGIFIADFNSVNAHQLNEIKKTTFDNLAQELIDGLNEAFLDDLTVRSGYGRPGIKISSFHGPANKNDKLLHNIANGFNARLLAALIRKSDGRFKFIAQFNKQFSDKYGASCTTANDCVEIRKKSYQEAEADILITGTLSIYGQNAFLTYRATGTENGLILAATSRTTVPLPHPYHKKITFPRVRLPENYRSLLLSQGDHHGCMEVEYFQQSLKRLGYRPGRITGTISSATQRAIKAYQWHHNLPETGIFTCSLFLHVKAQMPAGYGW